MSIFHRILHIAVRRVYQTYKANPVPPTTTTVPSTQESPMHASAAEPYAGFYNLTLGYRRDASIPCPYGYTIEKKNRGYKPFSKSQLAAKNKTIAWFVSNCGAPSKRMDYVRELQKHIKVDIYGSCGNGKHVCPRPAQRCNKKLEKEYRFYLALENSICKDYITEKLWNQGYQAGVVPIVMQESIMSSYVPEKSYIALDQYDSPSALALHLKRLMADDEAYSAYFHWKQDYEVIFLDGVTHDWRERPWGVCRLCKLIMQKPRPVHVVPDIRQWFVDWLHRNHVGVCVRVVSGVDKYFRQWT